MKLFRFNGAALSEARKLKATHKRCDGEAWASMGPRFRKRGNDQGGEQLAGGLVAASMGPRFRKRGN